MARPRKGATARHAGPHPQGGHRRVRRARLRRGRRRPHRPPRTRQQGAHLLLLRQQARPVSRDPARQPARPRRAAAAVVDGPATPTRSWPPTSTRSSGTSTPTRTCRRIMLRELADGGRHLDVETLRQMLTLPPLLFRLVGQGRDEGAFGAIRPADAALRAHGHRHAHGQQRPHPAPRPPAGTGAASARPGGDDRAVAGRRPSHPSQGPHRCFDRTES